MVSVLIAGVVAAVLIFQCGKSDSKDVQKSAPIVADKKATSETTQTTSLVAPSSVSDKSTSKHPNGSDGGYQSVFFKFDSYEIEGDMKAVMIDDITLAKKDNTVKIVLEGNCDESGSDEYNQALGLKRAKTVKSILTDAGVNAENISLVSLGEHNPLCTESTQECWSQNRRVDFKLRK